MPAEEARRLPAIREHVKRAEALADEAERQAEEWRVFARELIALTEGASMDTTAERRFRRRHGVGRKNEGTP